MVYIGKQSDTVKKATIVSLNWGASNMESKGRITGKKTICGYSIADLIGIAIMIGPFLISTLWKHHTSILGKELPFLGELPIVGSHFSYDIMPNMAMALVACVFFIALVVRYDFFRKDGIVDIIVSIVRAFLDIWVLAAFLSALFPKFAWDIETVILVAAALFTWLGMKAIAGYSWIIVIVLGIINLETVSKDMGGTGAIFIILITISLLLQVASVSNIKDFFQDFRGSTENSRKAIKEDINAATLDAKDKIGTVSQVAKTVITKRK